MPKKISELHPVGVPNHAFAQWGMDLVGPLSSANECFLMVLTEYQTKWAEVYPIPNIQATTVFKCLKKVIGRFGVPETIIPDQGREFCNELNDNFCKSLVSQEESVQCIILKVMVLQNGSIKQFVVV